METIILVPGIEGSCLSLGQTPVWPPTLDEIAWEGYHRISELLDPAVVATAIWAELPVWEGYSYPVYRPIMTKLDQIAGRLGASRVDFYYDWRVDLWQTTPAFTASSEMLAQRIAKAVSDGATLITLVCHSMGNLVARLVLESQKYRNADWFAKISRLICICGPHLGAAAALGHALGCEDGALGLSSDDYRQIANNPLYPAGFQCFPKPGTEVLLDTSLGQRQQNQDVYDTAVDEKYQLMPSNARAAATSWHELDFKNRPDHVTYYLIAGTGYQTSNAYLYRGTTFVQTITVDGDGTVPVFSALAGSYSGKYTMPGDHVGILGTVQLADALDEIFGLSQMRTFVMAKAGITINLNKRTFAPDEIMQLLIIPDTPTTAIRGRLTVSAVPRAGAHSGAAALDLVPYGGGLPLEYQGPEIAQISARWTAPRLPGAYVMRFEGDSHQSSEQSSVVFFVNARSKSPLLRRTP
ncbi:lipase family alpha/beta hydrolase [Bradyrhizobium sp. HKCCYLS1011]|uniref:esterase/lipase family protein n=1 Tax=Bradyrhizobium sp. HKCCYLS1011 TaxID=3420733 RepID=UPI003EB7F2B2